MAQLLNADASSDRCEAEHVTCAYLVLGHHLSELLACFPLHPRV